MNTLKLLSYAGIGSIALAVLAPTLSFAETDQVSAENSTNAHSLVHRVSHSLADAGAYTSGTSGYKWGKKTQQSNSANTQWAQSSSRGGYKWGSAAPTSTPESQSYAGEPSYQWGAMSFSDQSGNRWGMRSFSEQSGNRWGMR